MQRAAWRNHTAIPTLFLFYFVFEKNTKDFLKLIKERNGNHSIAGAGYPRFKKKHSNKNI
jgi:5,10-methylenetetrahydrofolate reductase